MYKPRKFTMKTTQKQLDGYSMMIVSKYFEYKRDYINMICVNSKFKDTLDKFHYNPITVQNTKLFKNMETQHIYTKKSVYILGMYQYIIWYQVFYETFKQNSNKNIIFKRIRCTHKDRINNNGEIPNDCNILYDTQTSENFKQELTIPQSIIYIFPRYFQFSESIKFVKLSSNIHLLKSFCFSNCSIQGIDLSFVTSIGNNCFLCCNELTAITFTKHLEHIGHNCFYCCTNLTNIKIKEQVTQFNCQVPYFIYNNLSNQNIKCLDVIYTVNDVNLYGTTIPNICNKLDSSCFSNCQFTSYTIPTTITSIGNWCFCNCVQLKNITIPTTITTISECCFWNCTSLTHINCPSVTSLKSSCFFNCNSLESINYLTNIKFIDSGFSISETNFYLKLFDNIKIIPPKRWKNSLFIDNLIILDSIQKIGSFAFEGCTELTTIKIENSVTSIGKCSFKNCNKVLTVTLSNKIKELNNSIFELCTHLKEIIIPNTVHKLGKACFQYCSSLSNVIFPSNLQRIENNCFHGCINLIEMKIPNSVTFIGNNCFKNCKSLTLLTLPSRHIINGKLGCSNHIITIN